MAVSKRLRFEILRRDGHTCRYCGAAAPDVKLTVDHVLPEALGGSDEASNLVTACDSCNSGKTSTSPDSPIVADIAADAIRWSVAIQSAAAQMLGDLDRRNELRRSFDEAWLSWKNDKKPLPRPEGWGSSVDRFLAAGLPFPVLLECLDKAMTNNKVKPSETFRYMCGIAWKRVTELQDAARSLVGSEVSPDGGEPAAATMYGELISMVFGLLHGVSSEEEADALAEFRREVVAGDGEEYSLDRDGFAAMELLDRHSFMETELRSAAAHLLKGLSDERNQTLRDQAEAELSYLDHLGLTDRGHLWKCLVTARMFSLAAWSSVPEVDEEKVSG
jgi:hypothetical protein